MRVGCERCKGALGYEGVGPVFGYGYIFHAVDANGTNRFRVDCRGE
jgi:hypothetical protein